MEYRSTNKKEPGEGIAFACSADAGEGINSVIDPGFGGFSIVAADLNRIPEELVSPDAVRNLARQEVWYDPHHDGCARRGSFVFVDLESGFDVRVLPGHRLAKNFFEANGFSARLIVMHRDDDR